MALLGLTTYRQNNNIKSMVLLLLFPVLLLALLGFVFFFVGEFSNTRYAFYDFNLEPVLGTGDPLGGAGRVKPCVQGRMDWSVPVR